MADQHPEVLARLSKLAEGIRSELGDELTGSACQAHLVKSRDRQTLNGPCGKLPACQRLQLAVS